MKIKERQSITDSRGNVLAEYCDITGRIKAKWASGKDIWSTGDMKSMMVLTYFIHGWQVNSLGKQHKKNTTGERPRQNTKKFSWGRVDTMNGGIMSQEYPPSWKCQFVISMFIISYNSWRTTDNPYWSQKLQLLRMAPLNTHQLQLQEMLNWILRLYTLNILYTWISSPIFHLQCSIRINALTAVHKNIKRKPEYHCFDDPTFNYENYHYKLSVVTEIVMINSVTNQIPVMSAPSSISPRASASWKLNSWYSVLPLLCSLQ